MLAFIETLPIETQNELRKLTDQELEATVDEMMKQAPNQQMQQQEVQANQNLNQAIGQIV